jgi:prolyl-tRNA synthetase
MEHCKWNVPFLGQNFAKALMLNLLMPKENKNMFGEPLGVSTRLMGALVMTHSDDQGLVLPQFSAYKWCVLFTKQMSS